MQSRLWRYYALAASAYFSLTLPLSAFGFIVGDRWNTTATNGNTGSQGTPITLTWGFVADGVSVSSGGNTMPSDLIAFLDDNNIGGTSNATGSDLTNRPWWNLFNQGFDQISQVSGLTFVYEPNDTGQLISGTSTPLGQLGVRPDIRMGGRSIVSSTGNTLAFAYFPDNGDIVFDTDDVSFYSNSGSNYRRLRNTLMHEVGHALGISHVESNNAGILMEPFISTSFDGPQLDDILAIQRNYGDALEKNGGNNNFQSATPLGDITASAVTRVGRFGDSTSVSPTQTDFVSIDDNSDVDFFSFTLASELDLTISLVPRGATYNVGPQNGTQSSFNAKSLSNLTLALYDTNGTSQLDLANASGAGLGESINRILNPGTYYARVTGADNNVQLYGLDISASLAVGRSLVWTGGVNEDWNIEAAANFAFSDAPSQFRDEDFVTFDNTSGNRNVNIAEDVSPASITVDNTGSYTFSGGGSIVAGSLTLVRGTLHLANDGNSYDGPTRVQLGTLIISGDANAMDSPITVAATGTLVMDATAASEMASSFTINSFGVLQIGTPTSDANLFPDNPTAIVNNGTILAYDEEELRNMSGTGSVSVAQETIFALSNTNFEGMWYASGTGVINLDDAEGFGTPLASVNIAAGGNVTIDFTTALPQTFNLIGDGNGDGALRIGADSMVTLSGNVIAHYSDALIKIDSGSTLRLEGTVASSTGGDLTIEVDSHGLATVVPGVTLDTGNFIKTGAGELEWIGVASYSGTTHVDGGVLTLAGATGTGLTTIDSGATLRGGGTVAGDLSVLAGATVVATNVSDITSDSVLNVFGSYTQQKVATLRLELRSESDFDSLAIGGLATLGGLLEVDLATDFSPIAGNTFEVVTAEGGIAGEFHIATTDLPSLTEGLEWIIDYGATNLLLSVAEIIVNLPGDFNLDGRVDAADYTTWRDGLGVDYFVADYELWRDNFGRVLETDASASATATAAVPEQGSLALIILCACLMWNLGRNRAVLPASFCWKAMSVHS